MVMATGILKCHLGRGPEGSRYATQADAETLKGPRYEIADAQL
jgi:hypothetical protein